MAAMLLTEAEEQGMDIIIQNVRALASQSLLARYGDARKDLGRLGQQAGYGRGKSQLADVVSQSQREVSTGIAGVPVTQIHKEAGAEGIDVIEGELPRLSEIDVANGDVVPIRAVR